VISEAYVELRFDFVCFIIDRIAGEIIRLVASVCVCVCVCVRPFVCMRSPV